MNQFEASLENFTRRILAPISD